MIKFSPNETNSESNSDSSDTSNDYHYSPLDDDCTFTHELDSDLW